MGLVKLSGELDLDTLQGVALDGDAVVDVPELFDSGLFLTLRHPHLIILILELIDLELQGIGLMLIIFLQLAHSRSQVMNLI